MKTVIISQADLQSAMLAHLAEIGHDTRAQIHTLSAEAAAEFDAQRVFARLEASASAETAVAEDDAQNTSTADTAKATQPASRKRRGAAAAPDDNKPDNKDAAPQGDAGPAQ